MDARGIPIEQLQVLVWGAIEALTGIDPSDYVMQGGTTIGKVKPVVVQFLGMLEHLEAAAVDGLVSWEEVDTFLTDLRSLVQTARDQFAQ